MRQAPKKISKYESDLEKQGAERYIEAAANGTPEDDAW